MFFWTIFFQTEVYRSDFEHERQDRQRVMGELDEMKKELKKHQRELKKSRPQVGLWLRTSLKSDDFV